MVHLKVILHTTTLIRSGRRPGVRSQISDRPSCRSHRLALFALLEAPEQPAAFLLNGKSSQRRAWACFATASPRLFRWRSRTTTCTLEGKAGLGARYLDRLKVAGPIEESMPARPPSRMHALCIVEDRSPNLSSLGVKALLRLSCGPTSAGRGHSPPRLGRDGSRRLRGVYRGCYMSRCPARVSQERAA